MVRLVLAVEVGDEPGVETDLLSALKMLVKVTNDYNLQVLSVNVLNPDGSMMDVNDVELSTVMIYHGGGKLTDVTQKFNDPEIWA